MVLEGWNVAAGPVRLIEAIKAAEEQPKAALWLEQVGYDPPRPFRPPWLSWSAEWRELFAMVVGRALARLGHVPESIYETTIGLDSTASRAEFLSAFKNPAAIPPAIARTAGLRLRASGHPPLPLGQTGAALAGGLVLVWANWCFAAGGHAAAAALIAGFTGWGKGQPYVSDAPALADRRVLALALAWYARGQPPADDESRRASADLLSLLAQIRAIEPTRTAHREFDNEHRGLVAAAASSLLAHAWSVDDVAAWWAAIDGLERLNAIDAIGGWARPASGASGDQGANATPDPAQEAAVEFSTLGRAAPFPLDLPPWAAADCESAATARASPALDSPSPAAPSPDRSRARPPTPQSSGGLLDIPYGPIGPATFSRALPPGSVWLGFVRPGAIDVPGFGRIPGGHTLAYAVWHRPGGGIELLFRPGLVQYSGAEVDAVCLAAHDAPIKRAWKPRDPQSAGPDPQVLAKVYAGELDRIVAKFSEVLGLILENVFAFGRKLGVNWDETDLVVQDDAWAPIVPFDLIRVGGRSLCHVCRSVSGGLAIRVWEALAASPLPPLPDRVLAACHLPPKKTKPTPAAGGPHNVGRPQQAWPVHDGVARLRRLCGRRGLELDGVASFRSGDVNRLLGGGGRAGILIAHGGDLPGDGVRAVDGTLTLAEGLAPVGAILAVACLVARGVYRGSYQSVYGPAVDLLGRVAPAMGFRMTVSASHASVFAVRVLDAYLADPSGGPLALARARTREVRRLFPEPDPVTASGVDPPRPDLTLLQFCAAMSVVMGRGRPGCGDL
ncbi:hypothetical protein [Humisphaera borealis]|uniref:Uncharacterized protein n=1 Tax=Humisphaera borealis TaxID=2807512 RepID=A0A7M2WZX4_9BACT|nr:hypothetical protein [Humisphaera borealis]QOV90953.1 hypothetical protein IPV69_06220 [Humisphaera borealis]